MESRVGWKTWSAFALVLCAGAAVFALLPRWVSQKPAPEARPAAEPAPVPEPPPPIEAPIEPTIQEDAREESPEEPIESGFEPESPLPVEAPDDGFAATMTEALNAMRNEDYALAREAFLRAKALRPGAPEAASGLTEAEEGLRNRAIAGHRDRGLEHERLESWRAAEREYDAALTLDGTLRFAREGKKRSAERAHLQERLDFQLGHPERLSDPRALEEASRLIDEARGTEGDGPKRRETVAKLEGMVASYSRPMDVEIVSDTLTDVTLHQIGRLGKFDRRVVEVRPGRYVAVGSRDGFRDVRVEFVVEPGKPLAPIRVLCQEAI